MNQLTKALDGNSAELRSNQHFPSARYFQVHFEYLHEIIRDLKAQIDTANQQLMEMQAQLQAVKQQEISLKPNHKEQRSTYSKMR
jgi:cell division protein FtsB